MGQDAIAAPAGTVTLAFTDIEGSTGLWQRLGDGCYAAIELHNQVLRDALAEFGGYEVKTEGDAFMVAFAGPAATLGWALAVQERLFRAEWPEDVLGQPEAAPTNDGQYRGPRVRIGIHTGEPIQTLDSSTGRADYFGLMVNEAARIGAAAHGGQVLLSGVTKSLALSGTGIPTTPGRVARPPAMKDLGEHRLKGIELPVQLWQALPAALSGREFPPVKSLDPKRTNLPRSLDSFVGRQRELEELAALLIDQDVPLVTLLGPGGIGKTRLSQRFGAAHLADFPGGVWFADATDARTAEGVCQAVGLALNVPLTLADPVKQVGAALEGRCHGRGKLLLIFDNAEQVVEETATAVAGWMRMSPSARFLVTSRERLNVSGEQPVAVEPLAFPEKGEGPFVARGTARHEAFAAVKLFLDRARRSSGSFKPTTEALQAISEICRELDGIPQAIELAASRVGALTPAKILEMLPRRLDLLASRRRDASARQQTLRGAIGWSWDLLKPWEQSALAQCSVFAGGFLLDAATAVIDVSEHPDAPLVFDIVAMLVDKSMLRALPAAGLPGETRYRMYESIREFAAEKLGDGGIAARRRHAEFYVQYAEHWDGRIPTVDALEALARVQLETENLFAVQDGMEADDAVVAARAIRAADATLRIRGPWLQRIPRFDRALGNGPQRPTSSSPLPPAVRIRLLVALGWAAFDIGDRNTLARTTFSAVALAREDCARTPGRDPELSLARALRAQSLSVFLTGDLDAAASALEEGIAIARRQGDRATVARCIGTRGLVHKDRGELSDALACFAESEAVAREFGNAARVATIAASRSTLYEILGDHDAALACCAEAEAIDRQLGDQKSVAASLGNRGTIQRRQGKLEEAELALTEAEEVCREIGDKRLLCRTLIARAQVQTAGRAELGDALRMATEGRELRLEMGMVKTSGYFETLATLAVIHHRMGDSGAAEKSAGEARALAEELKLGRDHHDPDVRDAWEWLEEVGTPGARTGNS